MIRNTGTHITGNLDRQIAEPSRIEQAIVADSSVLTGANNATTTLLKGHPVRDYYNPVLDYYNNNPFQYYYNKEQQDYYSSFIKTPIGVFNFSQTGYRPVRAADGRPQILGQGKYALVLVATEKENLSEPGSRVKTVAIKVNKASQNYFEAAKNEIAILQRLRTEKVPFVTELLNTITLGNSHQVGLVFAVFKGNLNQLLMQQLDQIRSLDELSHLFQTLLLSLAGLRNAGVVHTDLKPENVLLNAQGQAHIGDFGLAFLQELGSQDPLVQTAFYRSPEVHLRISDEEGKPAYTFAIDMFSLGATMYECLSKVPLFPYCEEEDQNEYQISMKFLYAMEQRFGPLPKPLIEKSSNKNHLFNKETNATGEERYQLKVPVDRNALPRRLKNTLANIDKLPSWENLVTIRMDQIKQSTVHLSDLEAAPIIAKHRQFFDLITQMLKYEDRITPTEALNHSFFISPFQH